MKQNTQLGKRGEELAVKYLEQKGFTILHRNWRFGRYEIDIIALKDGILHFVEVKLRSYQGFGAPEENVTKQKMKFLMLAADEFLHHNKEYRHISFDILSITDAPRKQPEYFFIQDVYL